MNFNSKIEKFKETLNKASLEDAKKSYYNFLKRLPDISHLKNIVLFSAIASVMILILFPQRFASLYTYLPKKPLFGGTFEEGVVGRIEQFNPLFVATNSAEQTVSKLLFLGLTKKDGSKNVIPDLAESWEVSSDGRTYTFTLKENIKWQDGADLSADDVVFTIGLIQNPDVKSPYLNIWKGVEVTKSDNRTVVFRLPNAYATFLSITDFAIVPKHLLEKIPPRNIKTSEFSLKPIGAGPFKLTEIKKIKESDEIILEPSENYYGKQPYIEKFIVKSYPDEQAMVAGYVKKEIKGIERIPVMTEKEERALPTIKTYETALPSYDVLYFNLRSGITKDKSFREAISFIINRDKIIEEVYQGQAERLYTPILPGYLGYEPKLKRNINQAAARKKLTSGGFTFGSDGFLRKGRERVSVRLVTSSDQIKSKEAAEIATSLGLLGIEVKQERLPIGALVQDRIRSRDFDLLLISQNLGSDSDLYPYWHGTQVNDPGLNMSGFSDRRVDKYLEQGRSIMDSKTRAIKYKSALEIIWQETPAVFLVRPSYRYGVSAEVKGVKVGKLVDAADRFWDVTNWYIRDERTDR